METRRWRSFIKAHLGEIAAADFFTVEVLTWHGWVRHWVFFVMDIKTRRIEVAGMTATPLECHAGDRLVPKRRAVAAAPERAEPGLPQTPPKASPARASRPLDAGLGGGGCHMPSDATRIRLGRVFAPHDVA